MLSKQDSPRSEVRPRPVIALLAFAPLLLTGCLSSLAKHSDALAAATAPVIDQATAAYASANAVHNLRVDADAYVQFDIPSPVYNPLNIQPLLTDKDIQVRLSVLAAFEEYVKSVVAITEGVDSPALQAAAKSAGQSISGLGNLLAPTVETDLNLTAPTTSTTTNYTNTSSTGVVTNTSTTASVAASAISPAVQNGIATAADALGQFLISRKVKKELPAKVVAMDKNVQTLCTFLENDVDILTDFETRDYKRIISDQTQFILDNKSLDPAERRDLIMKLPGIVREERASLAALKQLKASITRLALVHHAFAADAQGNNPESFKQKVADLEAVGGDLGKFYSSLPAK